MIFYLGTHQTDWLSHAGFELFVSHRRLRQRRRRLAAAAAPWALDSGGFTELSMYGEWTDSPQTYAAAVDRYADEVGQLTWVAPQDWMCEPVVRARTGLDITTHQARTVASVLNLRGLVRSATPVIAVLQGWQPDDYWRHLELYGRAGLDLTREPVVGLGSVCRRQHTAEIDALVSGLAAAGLRLHGFGVKTLGLRQFAPALASADSMAWSLRARKQGQADGRSWCGASHRHCGNCLTFARDWRAKLLAQLDTELKSPAVARATLTAS